MIGETILGLVILAGVVCLILWAAGVFNKKKPGGSGASSSAEHFGSLSGLGVKVFVSKNCPWCHRAQSMLKDSNMLGDVEVIDVSTLPANGMQSEGFVSGGVPAWKSTVTGKTTTGFKAIDQLVKDLS